MGVPVSNRYYGNNGADSSYYLTNITGTAYDAFGVDKVEVRLFDVISSSYWWTSGWSVSGSSWHVAGSEVWEYGVPPFVDGKEYRVESRAYDESGNLGEYATSYFYYDGTIPEVNLDKPDLAVHNSLPTITGTSWDNDSEGTNESRLYKVEVRIWWKGNNKWWDNSLKSFDISDSNRETSWYDVTDPVTQGVTSDNWYMHIRWKRVYMIWRGTPLQ